MLTFEFENILTEEDPLGETSKKVVPVVPPGCPPPLCPYRRAPTPVMEQLAGI